MMKLSIIVPVYNEETQLERVVHALMQCPCPLEREWIFVDDASRDQSLVILKELQKRYTFRILEHKINQGKGSAVVRGISESSGDFIMVQDADQEYDPADVPALLEPLIQGKADVVYGSRFKGNNSPASYCSADPLAGQVTSQSLWSFHRFVNRFLTVVSNALSGLQLTDMETCYKIFRADLLKSMRLSSRRFGIEVELTAYVGKINARVTELPISYFPRKRLQGKKITWKDGVAALWHLIRFNCLVSFERAFENLPSAYLSNKLANRLANRQTNSQANRHVVKPVPEDLA
jgi:glycosyltransferase involved in cell wall biosynthesis